MLHYEAKCPSQEAARVEWMRKRVGEQPDWGYRRVWGRARNQGGHVSLNRVHRLWQKYALQQPQRVPRRKLVTGAKLTPAPRLRNHIWCYDFVHDRDAAGRVIRCHTVKDEATADALAVVPARAYNAADVRAILKRLVRE